MNDPKPCRYCGRLERTVEHALASQLADLIPQPEAMTAERLAVAESIMLLSGWDTQTPAAVKVRDFCSQCNSGFMSDLDTRVKAQFAKLCRGEGLVLDQSAVDGWSSWIAKQYLSYQSAYPEDYSDPDAYHAFFSDHGPVPEMQIYVGLGAGLPWPHLHARRPIFARPMFDPGSDERRIGLQIWTATYGQLIVQVLYAHLPELRTPLRDVDGTVARLWPDPQASIDLTTMPRSDAAGLAELTKARRLFGLG
jgi:hypothetical protein